MLSKVLGGSVVALIILPFVYNPEPRQFVTNLLALGVLVIIALPFVAAAFEWGKHNDQK